MPYQPVARAGDTVFCAADLHVVPPVGPTPFPVTGNIVEGSTGSFALNQPIAREGDQGVHAVCPGPNTFTVDGGATYVFDAFGPHGTGNKAVARVGDPTQHCGDPPSQGTILTGAFTVLAE